MASGVSLRVIGLDIVRAKLALAVPNILATNAAMVATMLEQTKVGTIRNTPLGPGHFGYHLRDRITSDIEAKGTRTVGKLLSPRTGYWREYGTRGRYRGGNRIRKAFASFGGYGTGGERAFLTAHKAAGGFRRTVAAFYSGLARWWGLRRLSAPRVRTPRI